MMYFVIAKHWDDERKCGCKYVAGQFDDYVNASLFRSSYNSYYSTDAVVVDEFQLINSEER